jgi:hypothetical protein
MNGMRAIRSGATKGVVGVPEGGPTRSAQRRNELRRGVSVACEAVAGYGFRLLGQRALDVSSTGMLIETRGSYARIGEEVIVSFQPPQSRLWIDAVAKVARVVKGRRRTDRAQAIGLSFVSMDAADRAILAAKLRGHPPPVPGRELRIDYAAQVSAIAER